MYCRGQIWVVAGGAVVTDTVFAGRPLSSVAPVTPAVLGGRPMHAPVGFGVKITVTVLVSPGAIGPTLAHEIEPVPVLLRPV